MAFGMTPVCKPEWPNAYKSTLPLPDDQPKEGADDCASRRAQSVGAAPVGEALVAPLYLLDELAWGLGVLPLSRFTDDRLLPDELADDPEQALTRLGPREDWHAVADGLRTCDALLSELRKNPQAEVGPDAVLALQALRDWLGQAAEQRCVFRLDAV